jgi:hypothetical protein
MTEWTLTIQTCRLSEKTTWALGKNWGISGGLRLSVEGKKDQSDVDILVNEALSPTK